jgi:hypothetical protein
MCRIAIGDRTTRELTPVHYLLRLGGAFSSSLGSKTLLRHTSYGSHATGAISEGFVAPGAFESTAATGFGGVMELPCS